MPCLDGCRELEDGQVHADDHAADQHAQHHHDHRLDQAGQRVDGVVDLLLIVLGHLEKHGVQRAGLFADGRHLDDHVREEVGLLHCHVHGIADRNVVTHQVDRLLMHAAADRPGDRVQHFHERYAGYEGHCGGPCEPRDRTVVHDLDDHRNVEDHAVQEVLETHGSL